MKKALRLALQIGAALALSVVWRPAARGEAKRLDRNSAALLEQQKLQAIARKPPGGEAAANPEAKAREILAVWQRRVAGQKTTVGAGATVDAHSVVGVGPTPTPDTCPGPVIKTWLIPSPLEPGDQFTLNGCGFGAKSPDKELLLVSGGFPGNSIKLEIDQWFGGWLIKGRIPPGVTGLKDDPQATVQVAFKNGHISNGIKAGFRATREVRMLKRSEITFQCQGGTLDWCDLGSSAPGGENAFYKAGTFSARHDPYNWDPVVDCETAFLAQVKESIDKAVFTLANGWLTAGYAWWWCHEVGDDSVVFDPTGFVEGQKSNTISVDSRAITDTCQKTRGGVSYRFDVWVIGPKGVAVH